MLLICYLFGKILSFLYVKNLINGAFGVKNVSLIETKEYSGNYILSPAYDLLPVNVIMPEDNEEFALAMNGKKTKLRKKDFLIFADECGISRASAEKMIHLSQIGSQCARHHCCLMI